ncbi:MAG: oligosaccharide flippase family protein, partial [Acidobacteriota bacterium]
MMDARSLTLNDESRQTLRQAAGLGLQRALQLAMGFLFAALIPRRMGPQVYGQFSTMVTMSLWFSLMSGLGAVSLMTRFVPEFLAREDREGLKKLASNLMTLRLANGLMGAVVYLIIGAIWLKDLDQMAIIFVAISIAARTVANLPFTLFLGQNRAARWGASDLLRRVLTFPFVFCGYIADGLRGAGAGLLAVELSVLALGLWWGSEFLSLRLMKIDREFLRPYLRFSAAFFVSNVMLMLFSQGGTTLVRFVSGDYAEAGFYTIAFGAYLVGTQGVWRLLTAFGP